MDSIDEDLLKLIFGYLHPANMVVFGRNGYYDKSLLIANTCKRWFRILMNINNHRNIWDTWNVEIVTSWRISLLKSTRYPPTQITMNKICITKDDYINAFLQCYKPDIWKNISLPTWNDLYQYKNKNGKLELNYFFEICIDSKNSPVALLHVIDLCKKNDPELLYEYSLRDSYDGEYGVPNYNLVRNPNIGEPGFKMGAKYFYYLTNLYEFGKVNADFIDSVIQYFDVTPEGLSSLNNNNNNYFNTPFPLELLKKYAEIPMIYRWNDHKYKAYKFSSEKEAKKEAYYRIWHRYELYLMIKVQENHINGEPFVLLPITNEYIRGFLYFYRLLKTDRIKDIFKWIQNSVSQHKYDSHVREYLFHFENILKSCEDVHPLNTLEMWDWDWHQSPNNFIRVKDEYH